MNLYGIYKRNTIDNVPEMTPVIIVTDAACTMSHVQTFQAI